MKNSARSSAVLLTLIVLAISTPGAQQGPGQPHWRLGDVFAGIGSWDTATGEYLVYDADGTPKMVADPLGGAGMAEKLFDGRALMDLDSRGYPTGSYTTGCAVGPDDHLYVTTFWGRKLRRFSPAHPHGDPILVYDFATNGEGEPEQSGIDAVESVVFDAAGNFYVGTHPAPRRDTSADPINPFTKIFKFPAGYDPVTSAPPTVYEVPNGEAGADWIDISPDGKTIYYTSQSSRVYWYRPAEGGQPESAGSFMVHEPEMAPTEGIGGRIYAFRALPPNPGETEPSGFVFAHYRGPVRTDRHGKIVQWYNTPGATGAFFGINISPDAKYFWTTNYSSGQPGSGGQLYKFNISHRDPVQGPIETGAPAGVYGLCVKREYTAGVNSCYASDLKGNILYDANGAPVIQRDPVTNLPMCKVPEVCGNSRYAVDAGGSRIVDDKGLPLIASGDEDGDGLHDDVDTDCIPSGPPRVLLAHRVNSEYSRVDVDISGSAYDPDGDELRFSATGLPGGLVMSSSGRITGTTPPVSAGSSYTVAVTVVSAAGKPETPVVGRFTWTITGNLPPVPTVAPRSTVVGSSVTDRIPASDADGQTLTWAITGLPTGLGYDAATGAISGRAMTDGVFTVSVTVTDDYGAATTVAFPWTVFANRPPTAVDDTATTVGSSPTPIAVLANDTDADNHLLTIVPGGFTQPGHGTTALESGAGFVYRANPGFFGVDTFTYTISDGLATDVATVRVTVAPTPICSGAYGGEIWPPNKRFHAAPIRGVTHPTGLPVSLTVMAILQDEPIDTAGDGDFTPDGKGVGTGLAWVRAERHGVAGGTTEADGNGRVYEILFAATDSAGASCTGSVLWTVPHERGQHATAIDDGVRYDSTGVIPGRIDK